jgi:hypothetical protein
MEKFPRIDNFDLSGLTIIGSSILKTNDTLLIRSWLTEAKVAGNLRIVYKGTQNGFARAELVEKVKGLSPLVIVIESTDGLRVGGYRDQPWKSSGWIKSKDCFVFDLEKKAKFQVVSDQEAEYAVSDEPSYLIKFGCDGAIAISNNCNKDAESYLNSGSSTYIGLTERHRKFKVQEIEIFYVVK